MSHLRISVLSVASLPSSARSTTEKAATVLDALLAGIMVVGCGGAEAGLLAAWGGNVEDRVAAADGEGTEGRPELDAALRS